MSLNPQLRDWKGKTAWLVGASTGIGRATASALHAAGAHVVVSTGFHPDPKIRINNGTPRPLTVDARFTDERPDLVADLLATVQRVSGWANDNPAEAVR